MKIWIVYANTPSIVFSPIIIILVSMFYFLVMQYENCALIQFVEIIFIINLTIF